jgi:transposase
VSKGKTFSQEFRDEAVRLTVTGGKSIAQVARELGVAANTLYHWRREAHYAHAVPVAEQESTEQEAARLRKELELVKQERDILKKAIAYFAQPPTK